MNNKLLAQVITSLIQYMKWQEKPYKDNITICTLGLGDVGKEIKTLKLPRISVKSQPDPRELSTCHIAYISHSEQNQLSEVLWKLNPHQVVSISNIEGFAEAGGTIQLDTTGGKLSFRININTAKEAKVVINSDLLSISKTVK